MVVDLTHTGQGDTSSGDYSLSATSVTFAADETSKTFTLTAASDDVDDDGDSVVLGFDTPLPTGVTEGSPDEATVNITDDDVPSVQVSFGAASYTVAEGSTVTVSVELSAAPERQVVVDLTHTGQGDTSSGDYSLSATSVTFAADETSKTFTLTAASDDVDDDGDSVVLGFDTPLPTGVTEGSPDEATVNITDDDVPSVQVSFGAASYTVAEGASVTVSVELSAAPERQVVVDLTHTGQGDTSSGDYSLSATSVTFAATETSKTFTLTAASDDVDDDGDSVLLGFDTPLPTGVTEGSPDEATVTITDDDHPAVQVSFGAGSYTVAEGSTVSVSVELSAAPERQVVVDLTHTAQGDTSSGDYSLSAASVTFAADETSKTFTFTAASDDVDDDGDSVLLGFDTPLPTGVTEGSPDEATVNITDDPDDVPSVAVSFGAASYTVAEGASVSVSVVLSAAPERQVVVDLTHTGQGDTSSGDYSLSAASVTFAADETSKTFTLTAASDDVDDDGDSVLLGFDTPLPTGVTEGSPDEATVTITDDDHPAVQVSFGAGSYTVAEGASVSVSVELSAAPERQVEVDLTHTAQGDTSSGDYSLSAASVTFAADETSKTFTLTAASDDVDDDGDSVLLGFDTPLPTGVTEGSPDEATVNITDDPDDVPSVAVSFGAGSYTVAEGASVSVSVVLSAAPERQVEVDLTHTGQGDTSSGDYSLSAASVTFAADETSKTFTLTAASDDVDDDGDSVLLGFDTPLPTGVTEGSPDEATVTITDDDHPAVQVSFGAGSYTVAEGSTVSVSVELSAAPERQVEVDLTHTAQGDTSSGDYSLSAASVTFAADETSKTFTFTAASDDVDDDGDSVLLGFDTPLPTGVTEGSPDEATVNITDDPDDVPSVSVSFGAASYTVAEGASVSVSVVLSAAPERQVVVDLTHTGQGDTSSGDYSLSAASVTFAADETSKTFTLTAASDDVDDDGDSVLLGFDTPLPTGVTEGSPDEATVTITDDDHPAVQVSFGAGSYTVAEGSTVTVSVELSAAPERQVEVDLTHTAQGDTSSGDYSLSAASVTFAADETSKTFTLTAASDDVDDDGDSVLLGFDTPLPTGVTEGSPDEATVNITDDPDDVPSVSVSFGAASYTVAEGSSVTVSVVLSAAPERQVEVDLTHTGQGDTSSGDYSLSATSVTFAATETSKTFTFTAASDDVDDDGDSVVLGFDTPLPTGVTEGSPDEATVSITDDPDDVPSVSVSFGAASYTVAEGSSVTVSVELSAAPERQVVVDLTHTGQGDTSSGDYSLSATSVTFAATETSKTFTLTAASDDVDDDGDSVVLGFDTPLPTGFAAGDPDEATVNITDDDHPAVQVSFGAGSYTVAEGSTVSVSVELSAAPERQVEVDLTHTGQGDTSSGDYSLSAASVTFAADETSKTFTFTAASDDVDDDGDSVLLGFDTPLPTGFSAGSPATATVSISDDDAAGVVAPETVTVTEGEGGVGYEVTLASEPTGNVTVTIGGVPHDDITLDRTTLTFTSGNWDTPQTVTVTAVDDTIDEDTETVTLTHTTSGGGYGTHRADVRVSIADNDDPAVRVSFEKDDHPTEEGAAGVGVALVLSAALQADTTVKIRVLPESTASRSDYLVSTRPVVDAVASDYVQLPDDGRFSVTFKEDKTLTNFGIKPLSDMLVEGDEQIVLVFDTLPAGVTEGSLDKATVTIADDPNDDNDNDDDNDPDDPDDPDPDDPDDPDPDPDDPDDDNDGDGVCQRGVEGEAMFEVSVGPRDMIAEGDNSRGIDGERATVTVSTVGGATCSQDRTITLDLAGTAVQGRDYSVVPGTLTLPAGKTSVTATVTALDDGDDIEPTETIDITLRHEGVRFGDATVRISPCDNAGRGWAFSWLTIEGLRRAHRRPDNVTSPFTLRVCFSERVSEMVINDYPYNANATLIIASHEVRPADEARHYVTGTLSNLRKRQQDQIWLVDVTADYTGYFAVTLLGSRFHALDGHRDNNHHHAYSWLWVTVP